MSSGYAIPEANYEEAAKVMAVPNEKVKKLGFFKRWLLKSVKDVVKAERDLNEFRTNIISNQKSTRIGIQLDSKSIDQPERAIQFTIYTANGGRVVETRRYDRKTDRHTNGLYVITNDQDFGREIDKIISMESLRG